MWKKENATEEMLLEQVERLQHLSVLGYKDETYTQFVKISTLPLHHSAMKGSFLLEARVKTPSYGGRQMMVIQTLFSFQENGLFL